MSENAEYELYYFDIRWFVETIRYMFKLKNVPFKDVRMPFIQVPASVPADIQKLCRFGQLPVLKHGDKILCQSQAIARYLAKKLDLAGKDEFEAAVCDELVDGAFDLWTLWTNWFYAKEGEEKAKLRKLAIEKGRDRYLTAFNDILIKKKKNQIEPLYLVGNDMTWSDIYLANTLDNIQKNFGENVVSEFPLLGDLQKLVFESPGIKEYIQVRPVTKL